jgi:diguanylate cyclase (GGDEF)-like protein
MLLVEVARRLKACLREEDPIGRLGGDEFGVLLTRIGSPQYASIVANKVLAELSLPVNLMGTEVIVGSSLGITIAPHDGKGVDQLMKNADMAMYQAKDKGRNNFRFYTSDMNLQIESRMELEGDLREAIAKQQFSLHYQPQVDLVTGEIVGA